MSINMISKKQIINNYGNKINTGSTKIQIILLTYRINKLQKHFSLYKKDNHSKKGFLNLVFKRRKLLTYLKVNNLNEFNYLLDKLNLRY